MRLFCMFDLPVGTPKDRRRYSKFRKHLIGEGFTMVQYSVYMRICPNRDYAKRIQERVRQITPPSGHVRVLMITEKQYEDMELVIGTKNITERLVGSERMIIL